MSHPPPIAHLNNSITSSTSMRALELSTSPVSPNPPTHLHISSSFSSQNALLSSIHTPYPNITSSTHIPDLPNAQSAPSSPEPPLSAPYHSIPFNQQHPQNTTDRLHISSSSPLNSSLRIHHKHNLPQPLHLPLHTLPPPSSTVNPESWLSSTSPSSTKPNLRAPPPSAESTPHHSVDQRIHPPHRYTEPDRLLFAKTLDDALSSSAIKNEQLICSYTDLNSPTPTRTSPPFAQIQQHNQWLHQQQLHQLLHDRVPQKIDPIPLPEPFAVIDGLETRHEPAVVATAVPEAISQPSDPTSATPQFSSLRLPGTPTALTRSTLALLERCADLTKPINTLGPLCFAGFYLVSLTRTIVRNHTVPIDVRKAFLAPQLHFSFTIRDNRDVKWRNVPTVQIPYDALSAAGDWLRMKLKVRQEPCTFKHIKDALQKAVTDSWADSTWGLLVDTLSENFQDVSNEDLDDALHCTSISGRVSGTPLQFFSQINCHKGAPDIRRDVDGAISARESLKWVLSHLGLNPSGCNISIAKFREEVFPLWKHHCQYVREHQLPNCCHFYSGGYFKKIMIHKHLYNINGCTSSYHVKDLFEGLDEVIKVWSNPTGMCVREAKCAAGLRYNVDKSFQSGIRSYSKAKFLEAAPHTAQEFLSIERELHRRVQAAIKTKLNTHKKCRRALRLLELKSDSSSKGRMPDILRTGGIDSPGTQFFPESPGGRKRKRYDQDTIPLPSTPREQKRKHAHLSLKRKEVAEQQVKQYLEIVRTECQKQQSILDSVRQHGEECSCREEPAAELGHFERFPTSSNTPVAELRV